MGLFSSSSKSTTKNSSDSSSTNFNNGIGGVVGGEYQDGGGGGSVNTGNNGLGETVNLSDSQIGDYYKGYKSSFKFSDDSTTITTYNTGDFGAIKSAERVALFGIESSSNIIRDAIYTNSATIDNLMVAGTELNFAGFDAARDFADLSDRSSERNANFAESLFSQSLNFADEQAYRAVETANISAKLVDDAWYSANNSILAITGDSIAAVERGVTDANIRATNSIERANDNALSSILAIVAGSSASVDQTNADALMYVSEAQKTESERTTDTLLKWGIGGMALVAAAFSLRK